LCKQHFCWSFCPKGTASLPKVNFCTLAVALITRFLAIDEKSQLKMFEAVAPFLTFHGMWKTSLKSRREALILPPSKNKSFSFSPSS
jgi:hypothetical protein